MLLIDLNKNKKLQVLNQQVSEIVTLVEHSADRLKTK